jgi:DNA polymerase III subunit delta'
MIMDNIVGHKKIFDFFQKVMANGNLSHAYVFVGPDHVGKETVAKKIAADILQVDIEKLIMNPDFRFISYVFDEKTGKTKKDISIDQIRECRHFLSEYSFSGGMKIVIINPAERMNAGAFNALLKSLEEPRSKTLIVLIVTDNDQIPKTILSRCQPIFFNLVSTGEIEKQLSGKISKGKLDEMIKLARGRVGLIIYWINNNESFEEWKGEVSRFSSLLNQPFYDKLKKVENMFGDKSDHIAARDNLEKILMIWQTSIVDLAKEDEKLICAYDLILSARQKLGENVHPRLLVEQILLNLP